MTGTNDGEDLREAREKWDQMTPDQKRKLMAESLLRVVKEYQEGHPRFMAEGLLRILTGAIVNLREYLEEGKDPDISWSSPFVELRYPVAWDWEAGRDTVRPITDEDLHNPADPIGLEWITETFSRILDITILKGLTKGAAFLTKGEETVSLIAPEIQEALDAMTEEERDAYLVNYGEPFVVGGAYLTVGEDLEEGEDLEDEDEEGEEPVGLTPHGAGRLEDTKPVLPFKGEVDGVPFSGSIVFAVHPLVVDGNRREAFYPVVVGIQFNPNEETVENPEDLTFPDAALWSPEDRETFWKALTDGLEEIGGGLLPEYEPPGTVPLSGVSTGVSTVTGTLSVTLEGDSLSASGTVTDGTPTIPTTDTMEVFRALGATEVRIVAPAPSRTRFLVDSPTRLSYETNAFLSRTPRLNLPRKWASIPRWETLVEEETDRLIGRLGERAFESRPGYPAPLVKRTGPDGRDVVQLTKAGRRSLEEAEGPRCFRRVDLDADKTRREYLVKILRVGEDESFEFSASMYGKAWTLVGDGPDQEEERLKSYRQGDLFEELPAHLQDEVENRLRNLEHIRDAPDMMEHIAGKFGAEGRNPVHFSAAELRDAVLKCGGSPDGLARVKGCLRALEEITFKMELRGGREPFSFSGHFLSGVVYYPKGAGDHGDGDFYLSISPAFLTGLHAFAVPGGRLRDVREVTTFDWGKKLTKEDRKDPKFLNYRRGVTRLSAVLYRSVGFTAHQKNLFRWMMSQITRKSDPTPKHRRPLKVGRKAADAWAFRSYGSGFCPLIPPGKTYSAALGAFLPSPEAGWTLYGTSTNPTATGGGHAAGLISIMGYPYPPGRAEAARRETVRKVLEDFRVVVVETMAGLVAAKWEGRWYSLEDTKVLPEGVKVRGLKWYFFLPMDPAGRVKEVIEADHAERHARGETDILWKVQGTETAPKPPTATAENSGAEEPVEESVVGLEGSPLWVRLTVERKKRKLSQAKVAALFGVTQQALALWEAGPENGKAVPVELDPLVSRWVEDGTPPTADELAARKTRRPGVSRTSV